MANPFAAAQFLTSAAQLEQLPEPDRPEVAFAGRSNAGKSSALNAICGHGGLARVSRTPGRTQLLNFFELPFGRLVDLPGYGYAEVAREQRRDWSRVLGPYIERRESLRGIVLIMDIRHPLTDFDRQMLDWTRAYARPCHVLLTKADKLGSGAARAVLRQVQKELGGTASAQLFSATAKTGVDDARRMLGAWLVSDPNSAIGT